MTRSDGPSDSDPGIDDSTRENGPPSGDDLEASTQHWMWSGVVLLAILIAAFPLYRLGEPEQRAEALTNLQITLKTQGEQQFKTSCAECHGLDGRGGRAPALRSQEFLTSTEDNQISQLIAVGIPGSQMSSFSMDFGGPMTQEQIEAIVAYLRSLQEDAPEFPEWRHPLSAEDLSGRDLFNSACAACHGLDLEGQETEEKNVPDLGPGSDVEDESDAYIANKIREGEDEMPAFGDTLTDGQVQEIIDYIREVQADR